MKEHISHPGRSVEFLSRLHDGELTAAERAHFESHRAHCTGCRHAAAEFEAALSLYRSSCSRPPAPDLAARILRKLQASSPRRRPFGVFFGIDLKWAAAFTAALVAVIIGFSIVVRRELPLPSAAPGKTIPVLPEAKKAQGKPDQRTAPSPAEADSLRASSQAPKREPPAQAPPAARDAAGDVRPAVLPSNAQEEEATQALRAEAKPKAALSSEVRTSESVAARASRNAEPSGGEGAVAGSVVSAEAPATRLVILAADGEGSVPALVPGAALELLAGERGREFLLIVETQGRVREVWTPDSRKSLAGRAELRDGKQPSVALRVLLDLRFTPGDRPRRLLVRVE